VRALVSQTAARSSWQAGRVASIGGISSDEQRSQRRKSVRVAQKVIRAVYTKTKTRHGWTLFIFLSACGASDEAAPHLPEAENAAQLRTTVSSASGVYLGEGILLTNWHVCSRLRGAIAYNDPGPGLTPYREGIPLDTYEAEHEA
jgi:hypothetical protein